MKTIVWFWFVLGAVSVAGKVVYTKLRQTATLECGVNSFTQSLAWRRRNDLIISNVRSGFPRKGISGIASRSKMKQETNLEITSVREDDAGTFSCEADRIKRDHTLVVVSVSASPSAEPELGSKVMLQCQVNGLDSDYTVQWKRPVGAKPTGTASETVELKPVASSDAGTWICTITHNGETHNENLDLKVKEPVTTAPSTTQQSKHSQKPNCLKCDTSRRIIDRFKWWVWVAIGVGCLVVVLLMVFVIVMCKRIRRKKKRILKMKNGRQLKGSKQYCQCNRPTAAARPQQGRRKEKTSTPPVQPLLIQ